MCPDIDLCKDLLVKILRHHIGKSIHLTGTDCRISSVERNVQRAFAKSDYRIGFCQQKLTVPVLAHIDRAADLISLIRGKCRVQKALAAFFRKTAFCYGKLIDLLIHRFDMKNFLFLILSTNGIRRICTFRTLHTIDRLDRFYIIFGKPQSCHDLEIHEAGFVIISISRKTHIRRRCLNTGKESNTQCHDTEDGNKTCSALSDLLPEIFV